MTVSEPVAYRPGPAPAQPPHAGNEAQTPPSAPPGAGVAPVAAFPVGGVMDLRRTQALRIHELEWLPKPHSAGRYLPESRVIRILDCEVEIIHDPGRALAAILPVVYLDLNRLIYIGNRAHPGTFMHVHLAQASTLAVARRNDEVVGFSLATHLDLAGHHVVLHNATAVAPPFRGRALTFLLNGVHTVHAFMRVRGREFYAAARTNNPLVFGTMLSSGPFFPDPDRSPPPEIRRVARLIAAHLNPEADFDDAVLIQRGAWKKVLAGTTPRHRRPEVNAYCDRHLRIAEGDGLIVVGKFSLATVARVLWRSVWKLITPRLTRF